jgi:uncharacterized protein YndB with AHSA1/START domain
VEPPVARNLIARSSVTVSAPPARVWEALVTPAQIKQYMFGSDVASDFRPGSPITWKGEWEGKAYQDHGVIKRADRGRTLEYTHFSPLAGKPDLPENHHTVTIELSSEGKGTRVTLFQDNNASEEERAHSEKNWEGMLAGLKRLVERES